MAALGAPAHRRIMQPTHRLRGVVAASDMRKLSFGRQPHTGIFFILRISADEL
jgi:hypothetical protein